YRAGLRAIKPGATTSELFAAGRREIAQGGKDLQTAAGTKAAAQMLNNETGINWHLHGVGIESGEAALDTLREGSVLAFEPMFSFGPDAFYLEDMITVTAAGHEVLSTGLPYTAKEIEAAMARRAQ
ncbi:MAG: M24 family metallopeptidase, partial [Candidatus Poribacteria bacterium]